MAWRAHQVHRLPSYGHRAALRVLRPPLAVHTIAQWKEVVLLLLQGPRPTPAGHCACKLPYVQRIVLGAQQQGRLQRRLRSHCPIGWRLRRLCVPLLVLLLLLLLLLLLRSGSVNCRPQCQLAHGALWALGQTGGVLVQEGRHRVRDKLRVHACRFSVRHMRVQPWEEVRDGEEEGGRQGEPCALLAKCKHALTRAC